jgi:dTDP-4-amino-4,6-dideoxygalactose transaminase
LADIGVFSLNRHKHINCGEGGVICTDNDDLAFKLQLSINHCEAVTNDIARQGKINEFSPDISSMMGLNLRGTELSAAIAREQLKKLDGIMQTVREQAKRFDIKVRTGCQHAYYRYAWLKHEVAKKVEEWEEALYPCHRKYHYITPLYRMPLFKKLGYDQHQCPVCEAVDENIVLAWLKETP